MKTLKYVLFFILIAIIALSIFIAIQPDTYSITRTREVDAPSALVHQYIDDYSTWGTWSPWLEQDPGATVHYSDKTTGVDATYSWKGDIIGSGNMKTLYVDKDSIHQRINFISPYESSSDVYWILEPQAKEKTVKVTWGMKGEMDFMEKAFALFRGGMDKMIGPDYERGLEKLDSVITINMKKYVISDHGVIDYGGGYYLYMTTASKQDETGEKMAVMFPQVADFMRKNGIQTAGKPFSRYEKWDENTGTTIFSTCIPVKERISTPQESQILCGYMKPHQYYKTTLKGDYTHLSKAWAEADNYIKASGMEEVPGKTPFEIYSNDPAEYPNPADWITEIYIPVK